MERPAALSALDKGFELGSGAPSITWPLKTSKVSSKVQGCRNGPVGRLFGPRNQATKLVSKWYFWHALPPQALLQNLPIHTEAAKPIVLLFAVCSATRRASPH